MFLTLLPTLIYTTDSWSIFDFDAGSPNCHGKQRSASDVIVCTGVYILLHEGKQQYHHQQNIDIGYQMEVP